MDEEAPLHYYINHPHNALLNSGYQSLYEKTLNGVTRDKNNALRRQVFTNE